jgi:hypothetical protein
LQQKIKDKKIMKNFFIILFLHYTIAAHGQIDTKLSLIQGIWQYSFPNKTGVNTGSIFKIVNNEKCLEFTYIPDSNELTHPLFKMVVGFQDSVNSSYENEEIDTNAFKADGLYYTEIISEEYIKEDGLVRKPDFIVPSYFECDGQVMSIAGSKLFEYEKVFELPYEAVMYLFRRSKRDERNYLKEYLKLEVLAIKPLKCTVYSKPDKHTNVQLNRDDVVVIIEKKGDWLKVEYGEDGIGWIKKEAVKQ